MGPRAARDAAFEDLIRRNGEDLHRYFRRRILNDADAAEAFGELMLTAWRIRRRMPAEPEHGRLWLYVVARNVMLSSRRTLARRSAAVQRLVDDAQSMTAMVTSPDESLLEVRLAIQSLSAEDAELIRLIYWDELRSHEAAHVLGLNPSTLRSRLAAARRQLRSILEGVVPGIDLGERNTLHR